MRGDGKAYVGACVLIAMVFLVMTLGFAPGVAYCKTVRWGLAPTQSVARVQGKRAFLSGIGVHGNPYRGCSDGATAFRAAEWLDGWMDGMDSVREKQP